LGSKNQVVKAAVYVFGFWWLFFTLMDANWSPISVVRNWDYVVYGVRYWVMGSIGGLIFGVWWIWFSRLRSLGRIFTGKGGNLFNGVVSTLGPVPALHKPPRRVAAENQRLPITSKLVTAWIEANQATNPAHVALFLAVWDVYSAHAGHPATHRKGGHANRRLYQHCLAVTDVALQDASTWVYEGVHSKKRGKTKRLIIAKRNPEFVFDAEDPLIPIIALAHDFGKLEAYKFDDDGQLVTREEGASTDHDDDRIFHDALGARMLARLPEYWKMSSRDRRAINLVIGHYHHPSSFPVDAHGLAIDDRMSALMEYLIYADKKTGMLESGRDATDEENEITEEQAGQIYKIFVDVITEFGRINGTGNKSTDASFKIAQKHDGLIVVKELELRKLMLTRLGWSLDEGESRYRVTMNLLYTLAEKGLLYDHHNGVDFSRYHPMYSVSFRSSKNGQHISSWEPVIIFKPLTTTPEFAEIGGLQNFGSRMVINKPLYTHNPGIRDPEILRDLIRRAFGEDVARAITIDGRAETVSQTKARLERANSEAIPVATSAGTKPATAAPATATPPEPVSPPAVAPPVVQQSTPPVTLKAVPAAPPVVLTPEPAQTSAPMPSPAVLQPEPSRIVADESESASSLDDLQQIDGAAVQDGDEVDASDLPSTDEASAFEENPFDGLMSAELSPDDANASSPFDDFGDFPPVPVAQDQDVATQPEASVAAVDETPPSPVAAPAAVADETLIVDRPGVAIVDQDAPKVDRRRQNKRNAEALDALSKALESSVPLALTAPVKRRKRALEPWMTDLGQIKDMIASGTIQVCGRHEGHAYLLADDIRARAAEIKLEDLIRLAKLPTMPVQTDGGQAKIMVGIPEA
jgi:hypothetical protein